MKIFLANLLWFFSTLPSAAAFALALLFPARAQRRTAARIRRTAGEPVIRRVPTSGSTGATKWVPYTRELLREFARAVDPWIFSLYVRHPTLLFSTHYWSITPFTKAEGEASREASDDSEYLGAIQQWSARTLFTVTPLVATETDPDRHAFLTLVGLVCAPRLGLISVWHPSSLLRLLERAAREADAVAAAVATRGFPARANQVRAAFARGDFASVWPHLKIISCWDQAFAATDAARLRALFPHVEVEGKGLLATEGVVTVPWFGRCVAAVRSHVVTLVPVNEEDEPQGEAVPVASAQVNGRYLVYLSTGNGSRNAPLGDVVCCTGRVGRTPVFTFLHRAGGVSDLHGEKLHPGPVANALAAVAREVGGFVTAFLTPRDDCRGYRLVCTLAPGARAPEVCEVERELGRNYYYRHTRNLGQLDPVVIDVVSDALAVYCAARQIPPATAKVPPLVLSHCGLGWGYGTITANENRR